MAISTILSSYGFANGGASARTEAQAATTAAKLAAVKAGTAASRTIAKTASAGSNVVISDAAKAAAASKADNAKNPAALSREVRAALDKRYAGGTKGSPDLSGMSGRALATIALDKTGDFSAAEVSTAKNRLREQTRTEFTKAMASGGGIAGLAAYSKQMVSDYDSMSSEERQARGWTDKFRASNATFVGTASRPTLFDHLD